MQFSQPVLLKSDQRGVSLAELLLVIVAVVFLVLLLGSIPGSVNLIGRSRQQSIAREIIAREIENKRSVTYINLTPGETQINDSRLGFLPGGEGKTIISDCDPLESPAICPNGESIKQITVIVSWKTAGKDTAVKVQTLISEGGLN